MPGPKGLPFIGTMWDYIKKDGYSFSQMFKVCHMFPSTIVIYRYIHCRYPYIQVSPQEHYTVVFEHYIMVFEHYIMVFDHYIMIFE